MEWQRSELIRLLKRLSIFTLLTKCGLLLRRTSSDCPSGVFISCWKFDSQSSSRIDCSSREVEVFYGQCAQLKFINYIRTNFYLFKLLTPHEF